MKKKLTTKQVTKKLDQLIRDILKIKAGDNPQCFVCGKYIDWFSPKECPKGLQVNHYVSRRVLPLRWDLLNVFPGCSGCNYTHQYNQLPFTKKILDEFGQERIDYFDTKVKAYKKKGKTMPVTKRREIYQKLKEYYERLKNGTD
jgi:hypothetical protein